MFEDNEHALYGLRTGTYISGISETRQRFQRQIVDVFILFFRDYLLDFESIAVNPIVSLNTISIQFKIVRKIDLLHRFRK